MNVRDTRSTPDPAASPDDDALAERGGPVLRDPRSQAALDNIGDDDQANLLDPELDEQPGDLDADGRSFADDVRSDVGNGNNGEPR
ncbi:hypothetical protein LDO32_19320 [Luteimonas sp. Y-2-2-4F]|nr:hypothetical protein [Luteimonas sp. Y-2-2-4F]MCD9033864.1 hypothetical protein [Luteimonas sp. Y-2-2-4F]